MLGCMPRGSMQTQAPSQPEHTCYCQQVEKFVPLAVLTGASDPGGSLGIVVHYITLTQHKMCSRLQRTYLGDIVEVVHPVDLALVLCGGDHLTLDVFILRDGEALPHRPRGHELGAMGVVDGVLPYRCSQDSAMTHKEVLRFGSSTTWSIALMHVLGALNLLRWVFYFT